MISKFDEIMERPIDDGYEENVAIADKSTANLFLERIGNK